MTTHRLADIHLKGINTRNTMTFCGMVLALIVGALLFIKSIPYISPLIIAFAISVLLEPLIKQLIHRIKLKRAFAGPAVIILVLAAVFFLLWAIIAKLVREFTGFIIGLPEFVRGIYGNLQSVSAKAQQYTDWLPFQFDFDIETMLSRLITWLTGYSQEFVKNAFSTAAGMPGAFMFMITMMLSTYFIITGREKYLLFFKRHFPQQWHAQIGLVRKNIFSALFGYIKAQLIIMAVLFVILLVGFLIIGVNYSYVFALLIAFLDALPVLGSGMIMIPWAIYNLIIGDVFRGIALIVLYLICTGVRRVIEPKIISSNIGASPLLTVTSMYAGLKIFGFSGLILGPILYILIQTFVTGMMGGLTFQEYFLVAAETDAADDDKHDDKYDDGHDSAKNTAGTADEGVAADKKTESEK